MTLKITILEGPGAGTTQSFDDTVELVEIGRDPEHCTVLFPADYVAVGRRHLGIRRKLGHYELTTNLQNPVLIDGREPLGDEPLGPTQELRLGRNGPRIKVETTFASALPATEPSGLVRTASQVAQDQRRTTRRIAAAVIALAVLVVVAGGGFLWWRQQQAEAIGRLVAELEGVEQTTSISPDVIAKVSRSTYLVLKQNEAGDEDPMGTAWVVGDGLLATNAHVAELFEGLQPGQRYIVRSTVAPYDTVQIDHVMLHPDYRRFAAAWDRTRPVSKTTEASLSAVDAPGAGYDVALLYPVPGSTLAPPLELASDEELSNLRPGTAVAYAGFPMEGLAAGGVNPSAPVPQTQIGTITAVTDYFLLPNNGAERFLVQHSLSITGGASGSPLVDHNGRVIAVVSGMNVIMLDEARRMPNAAGVNFAQRSDLLRELIENRVDAVAESRQSSWAAGFATFDDPVEEIPKAMLADWVKQNGGGEPEEVGRFDGTLSETNEANVYVTVIQDVIRTPGSYIAIAVSKSRADIDMALTHDMQDIIVKDDATDWYPMVQTAFTGGQPVDIFITARNDTGAPDYELRVWRLPGTGPVAGTQ